MTDQPNQPRPPRPSRVWHTRYTRKDLTLANVFTAARLLLIPVFATLWLRGDNERALWIFITAAATDLIDGFLARFLNQKSKLGALLDPIADKCLMLVTWIVGVAVGAVPLWVAVVVIARDAIIALGVLLFLTVWKGRHGPSAWRPTRIGKYAMACQSISIVFVIVEHTLTPAGLEPWAHAFMLIAAAMTVIAGIQYVVRAAVSLRGAS